MRAFLLQSWREMAAYCLRGLNLHTAQFGQKIAPNCQKRFNLLAADNFHACSHLEKKLSARYLIKYAPLRLELICKFDSS